MARTRDVDPILRRTVFHGPLSAHAIPDPRKLTIAQREKVVQHGLGDREPSVRKAAATMLGGWLDQAGGDLVEVNSTHYPYNVTDDSSSLDSTWCRVRRPKTP
jgi:condensin complex subunit 3